MAGRAEITVVAPAVMERCHRGYIEGFWQYTRACPGALRRPLGDPTAGTLIRSAIPSATANVLFLGDSPGPVEPWLKEAESFFGKRVPWRVVAMGARESEVGRWALTYHLRAATSDPGMVLDPIPPIPALPAGLVVRGVTSAAGLRDFEQVWCVAFRIPRWIFPFLLPEVPGDDPEFGAQNRLFVGYAEQRPVACSSVTVVERVATLFSVGTVPGARGRGYGAALTWKAVEVGRSLGADVAYLAASQMGYGVYEKMGFRRVAEYPTWDTPSGFRHLLAMIRLRPASRRIRRAHSGSGG